MADKLTVGDIMTRDVKVVGPDTCVNEVVSAMIKFEIGSIIVVTDDKPVGVISEHDILRRVVEPCLPPETTTARQIMTSPVMTISESASLDDVVKLMAEKRVRKIPVVKKDKLVGIVTYTDIVSKVLRMVSILGELI